jgi:hypothetical protein
MVGCEEGLSFICMVVFHPNSWPRLKRDQVYILLIGEALDHASLASTHFGFFRLVYLFWFLNLALYFCGLGTLYK